MSGRYSPKPTFLTTKGERSKLGPFMEPGIVMHYRDMARSMYDWKGFDRDGLEDMPYGFIEGEALFFYPGFAVKRAKGMGLVGLGAQPSTLDVYGNPYRWTPQVYGWTLSGTGTEQASDVFTDSDAPVLWNHQPVYDRIAPYIQIMVRALNVMHVNIGALNHPVLMAGVAGNPGDNVASIILKNAWEDGESVIPVVKPDAVGLQAVDLGVTDNTQNMLSVVDWCDSRIKGIMGLGNGIEKASGIGAYDEAGMGAMTTTTDTALELRRAWCDRVNDRFGLDISVEKNNGIKEMMDNGNMGDDKDADTEHEDSD